MSKEKETAPEQNTTQTMRYSQQGYGYGAAYDGGFESQQAGNGLDFRMLLSILWRKRITFGLILSFCLASAAFYLFRSTPVFETSALVEMSVRRPRIMSQQDAVISDGSSMAPLDILNTKILKLQGLSLRKAVAQQLRAEDPDAFADVTEKDLTATMGAVQIELVRKSTLVKITACSTNAVMAAVIANTYANVAVTNAFNSNKDDSEQAVNWLQAQAATQRKVLEEAEVILLAFRKSNPIETLEAQKNTAQQAMLTYSKELAEAVAARNAALSKFTDQHPAVRTQDQLIEVSKQQVIMETEYVKKIQEAITESSIKLHALQRDMEAGEGNYKGILRRMEEARLSADENTATIKLSEEAPVPAGPVRPRKLRVMALGLIIGLAGGAGLSLLTHQLEDRIWHGSDIVGSVGLKLLGSVPHSKQTKRDDLAVASAKEKFSDVAESFSGIRSVVDSGQYGQTFLVTSSIAREGKTICCCNLAIASAKSGLRTLLVDFDLRRPRIDHVFGVSVSKPDNLMQILSDESDQNFRQLAHATNIQGLDIISSRPVENVSPSEVMGSGRVERFVSWAAGNYDRVIIDSPPVGLVSDSLVLAGIVDGVIVVCRFNSSRNSLVRASVRRLQDCGSKIIGLIMNDVPAGRTGYHYSQYGAHSPRT